MVRVEKKMMNILLCILYLVSSHISHNVDGIQDTLELDRKPKLTNNSPLKTIHTKFGDIVDCIDIYKQPAFNHPLLKHHKLQRKPNFQIEKTSVNNSGIGSIFGFDKDECPEGTVPVLRTTEDDLSEEKSLLDDHILLQGTPAPGVHVAEVTLRKRYGPYYKVSGIISVYNPQLERRSQISMSHLWVENGPFRSTNKISAGWHVHPTLYGDYKTHFYATWTSDNFKKTGCYNVRCPGFVHINRKSYLGGRFPHVSVYGGPTYECHISITQDAVTKNWWLTLHDMNIGYFPAALFSNMSSGAIVGWGGRTRSCVGGSSPGMGSGYFPDGNSAHACYFRYALTEDASRNIYGPKPYQIISFTDKTKCFGVKSYGYQGALLGNVIQFGGPGGNCEN